jgi:hypothetical protein
VQRHIIREAIKLYTINGYAVAAQAAGQPHQTR